MGDENTQTISDEMQKNYVISVENVSKTYRKKSKVIEALKNITLHVDKGEILAVTGQSGSGKSTLLQVLGTLEVPSGGTVKINGTTVSDMSQAKRAKFRQSNLGFVFQFFYLQPFLTLRQNIELPQMFTHNDSTSVNNYIEELAEVMGIKERLEHLPRELSGGQIQRAAIARALVNHPAIILADEPTGNLDQKSAESIMQLLSEVRQKFGTTIVVVTHDARIASWADRVIMLQDGAIV